MNLPKTSVYIEALKVPPDPLSSSLLHLSEESFNAADGLRSALRDLQTVHALLQNLHDLAQFHIPTSTKES
jgi:hypothetical protein